MTRHGLSRRFFRICRVETTLGQFIGVRDDFHLNVICRWLCVFTGSETTVTNILFNGIMSTSHATDFAKKMLRGCHFMILNFMLLVPSGPAPMKRRSVTSYYLGQVYVGCMQAGRRRCSGRESRDLPCRVGAPCSASWSVFFRDLLPPLLGFSNCVCNTHRWKIAPYVTSYEV